MKGCGIWLSGFFSFFFLHSFGNNGLLRSTPEILLAKLAVKRPKKPLNV